MLGLNVGSGQRRFDTAYGWVNVDIVSRPPDQVPDCICDVGKEPLPYEDGSVDYVVLSQVYEHFHLGEGIGVLREAYRVLVPGGHLLVTVPNMRALAQRWLTRQISDYIFMVNTYGAFQGQPGDDHHWGWTQETLMQELRDAACWSGIYPMNQREIPGMDLAFDWWILGLGAIK